MHLLTETCHLREPYRLETRCRTMSLVDSLNITAHIGQLSLSCSLDRQCYADAKQSDVMISLHNYRILLVWVKP